MEEIKHDLHNHRTYLWIILGSFLGIALVMLTMRFIIPRGMQPLNNNAASLAPAAGGINGDVSQSYTKALANPDKPYTDEKGVVHPPLGGAGTAPAPYDPTVKVVAPPIGGNGKAPVAPVATVPAKAPAAQKASTTPTAPPRN